MASAMAPVEMTNKWKRYEHLGWGLGSKMGFLFSGSLSNNMSPAEQWINGTLAVSKKEELTSPGLLGVSAMHLFVAAGKIIQLCSQLLAPSALKVL